MSLIRSIFSSTTAAIFLVQCIRFTVSNELTCRKEFPGACTLKTFPINNDSWIDLLQTITSTGKQKETIIKKCLLAHRISVQSVMELASKLFTDISLQQYHESVLSVTRRLAIASLELLSAPLLAQLTFLPNQHLYTLYLVNTAVRRIPETVANLHNLYFLGIDRSYIRLLDLGLLCSLPKLTTLQLIQNQISLLLPAPEPTCTNSLRELHLDHNHLTALDIAVLAPFAGLQRLLLQLNLMHSFSCTKATSFPWLDILQLGPGNNLTWVAFDLLELPGSLTINLPDNQLQNLPTFRYENMPNLQRIYLDGNRLSTIDLAQFQEHQQLNGLHFSFNRLRSVTVSQDVYLPNLFTIELDENMLETFSLANCSFPQLNYISLRNNRLQFVPADVYMSIVSPSFLLNVQNNPLRCKSVKRYLNLISITTSNPPLLVTIVGKCRTMNYNGSIPLAGNFCDPGLTCRISELNIVATPGGLSSLAHESLETFSSIQIQRLVMGQSKQMGELLINASTFANAVQFNVYREGNIILPSEHTLQELQLQEARNLTTFTARANVHLQHLDISFCAISILPSSMCNLVALKELRLRYCAIKKLNLALLATLTQLEFVQLTGNNITRIDSPQTNTVRANNIQAVDLSYNRLSHLEMSVFGPLQLLNTLNLANNLLTTLAYPSNERMVTRLPHLSVLELSNNRLKSISFAQLHVTGLEYLVLSSNEISTVPAVVGKYPSLLGLDLSNNILESFDFTILQDATNLRTLQLHDNHLHSLILPSEMRLPNLIQLVLSNNRLKSVDLQL
uniref:Uncharacterized protein n=1 Tax=Anopheles christyi TaxID=43041 RepID=A0A182K0G4_9DIPT